MRTDLDEQDASKILANRLDEMTVSGDELLAWLAFNLHHDEAVITRARERGANIGAIGNHASDLRDRVESEIGPRGES